MQVFWVFFLPWKSWFKQWKWNKQITEVIQSSFLHGTKFLQMIGVIWVVFIGNVDYTIQHFIIILYIVLLIWLQRKKKQSLRTVMIWIQLNIWLFLCLFELLRMFLGKVLLGLMMMLQLLSVNFSKKNKILIYMAV